MITCAMYSRLTGRSLALARLTPDAARDGTPLTVTGSLTAQATARTLPFYDPDKSRRTAVG